MVDVHLVPESDIEDVHALWNDRLGELSLESVRERCLETPGLSVGAYEGDTLVGFCIGDEGAEGGVEIGGIAVEESHARRGIGTELLSVFEKHVAELGYECISLGSAGGYVDQFYAENGYEPVSVLVRAPPADVPDGYRDLGYDIREKKVDNGTTKLYIGVQEYDSALVEEIRDVFDDPSAIYIVAKQLPAPRGDY